MQDAVFSRYQRADYHFRELHAVVQQFKSTKPYEYASKIDPQTGELIYYTIKVDPVPDPVPVLAGDIIHNLRTCLEYLAWDLVEANGRKPGTWTGFPIYNASTKFVDGYRGKVNGMRQEAIDLICDIKPYKGGDDLLWRLHELDIVDKHHLLFTVWGGIPPKTGFFFDPTAKFVPLETGREFYRDAPNSEMNKNIDLRVQISLDEPGIVEGEALIVVLRSISNRVRYIVDMFASYRMRM